MKTWIYKCPCFRRLGADVDILDVNYDACVIVAKDYATDHQGLFVQVEKFRKYKQGRHWQIQA